MTSQHHEPSVLIALRELDSLEQQRRDREAAALAERAAAEARALAEVEARARAEAEAHARVAAEAEARALAERAREEQALRLRAAEVEAAVRAEQAVRLELVQAEIDAQHAHRSRGERTRQGVLAAGLLGGLGLLGALVAMLVTRTPAPIVAQAVDADELQRRIAMQEHSAALEAVRRELGQLRSDNAREQALLDAASTLLPLIKDPTPTPAAATPNKPRPPKPGTPVKDPKKPGGLIICKNLDDPLAEDCAPEPKKK